MGIFGGYAGPVEVHYLFVDGGALRGRLRNVADKHFGGVALDIDFKKVKGNFTKVFYYDAVPVRNDGESEGDYEERIKPNRAVLDAAAATDGIHVYEGDARRRRRRGLEQKKVDVQLTVDMLTHAFRKNMHKATLLTGDNDFKPLIDALVQNGMFVTLWYPVGETSEELMHAADARTKLTIRVLHGFLSPASQTVFSIPQTENKQPNISPGLLVSNWAIDGKECGLYKQPDSFVVTKQGDINNTLHVTHDKIEMLQDFCRDSLDIEIPEIALSRLSSLGQNS